jgi:hypothetical protein
MFIMAVPEALATTWPVTSCGDSGPDSLRSIVTDPFVVSGDTVDLSGLPCSTIGLTTSAVGVNQATLTLQGPGKRKISI